MAQRHAQLAPEPLGDYTNNIGVAKSVAVKRAGIKKGLRHKPKSLN